MTFSIHLLRRVSITLGLLIFANTCLRADLAVGTIADSISVDNKGSINYSVSLDVPPGRGGFQPRLTCNYSHNASNGPLGMGWSLSHGFPQTISRGRTIFARDGVIRGVEFEQTDKLYLDGKRLICVAGTNGAPGSVYRTEVDSFSEITAYGNGGLIERFEAVSKDGLKCIYGKALGLTDAYFTGGGDGNGAASAWALKRVENAQGDYVELSYGDHDFDGFIDSDCVFFGERSLTSIRYTGGVSLTPSHEVRFYYDIQTVNSVRGNAIARKDQYKNFSAGRSFSNRKRLDVIKSGTSGMGQVFREYRLGYAYGVTNGSGSSAEGPTLLKTVALFDGAATKLSETTVSYTNSSVLVGEAPSSLYETVHEVPISQGTHQSKAFADFNKDGTIDLVYATIFTEGTTKTVSVGLSSPTGYQNVTVFNSSQHVADVWANDFDADGYEDLVFFASHRISKGGGWYLARWNAAGYFEAPVILVPAEGPNGMATFRAGVSDVCDMDGDGRADIFTAYEYDARIWGGSGAAFFQNTVVQSFAYWAQFFDGISQSSMVASHDGSCVVFKNLSQNSAPAVAAPVGASILTDKCSISKADINGDGLIDLILHGMDPFLENDASSNPTPAYFWFHYDIYVNKGGFQFEYKNYIESTLISGLNDPYPSWGPVPVSKMLTGDFNGDGLTDLAHLLIPNDCTIYNEAPYSPWMIPGWTFGLSKGDGTFDWNSFGSAPLTVTVNGQPVSTASMQGGTWGSEFNGDITAFHTLENNSVENFAIKDVNKDGFDDLVFGGPPLCALLSNGGGFDVSSPIVIRSSGSWGRDWSFADFNGDLIDDVGFVSWWGWSNGWTSVVGRLIAPNSSQLLSQVVDGLGRKTDVVYRPTTDKSIYTRGAPTTYPIVERDRAGYVVSDLYKDVGGNYSAGERQHFSYQYSGRRMDLSGRGDLGFHAFVTVDHQTNLFKYQFLTQSFPMTGLTAREQTYRFWESGSGPSGQVHFRLISSHDNTVVFDEVVNGANTSQAYGTVYPFMSKAVESRWENSTSPHFTLTRGTDASSKPKDLFTQARPSGAHITISAQSWFDDQTLSSSPPTSLPWPYSASDRTTDWAQAGTNSVTGIADYAVFDALTFPRQITYGNLRQLSTDFGDGFTEKVVTTYKTPTSNGLSGLVDTVTTTVTSAAYGTESAPVKSYTYWSTLGGVATPLVQTETSDATDNTLDLTTTYGRDNLGRVTSTSISGYNNPGHPQHIGSYTVGTVESFDARFDLPTLSKNAYTHPTSTTYHAFFGLPTAATDVNGAQTTVQYDALGRATQTRDELKNLQTNTTYTWDSSQVVAPPSGVVGLTLTSVYRVQVTATAQPTVTTYYDRLSRPIRTIKDGYAGQQIYADTVYNTLGQVVAASAPYKSGATPQWTKTSYDMLGRVYTVLAPNGTLTTNNYNGRVTQVTVDATDRDPQTNTTYVDAKGRTVKVWNADSTPAGIDPVSGSSTPASIEFRLDGFGRMRETVLRGQSQTITAAYDAFGRQIALNDPDKGNWSYVNNALGQVVTQTDAKSTVTQSVFDRLGRQLTRTTTETAGGPVETASWYYYDTAANVGSYPHLVAKGTQGWVGALQREEGQTTGAPGYAAPATGSSYYYDEKGRLSTHLFTVDAKWFYTWTGYDTYSRVQQVRHYWRPPGQENPGDPASTWEEYGYTNGYDSKSYLTSVVDTSNRTWWEAHSTDGYDYMDRPVSFRKGGTHWTQNQYRAFDGLFGGIVTGSGTVQSLAYDYDGLGNLVTREDYIRETYDYYGYDVLNRVTKNHEVSIVGYHDNGNISWKKDVNGSDSGTYSYDANKPHAVSSAWGYSMSYDGNGNLLTRSGGGNTWTTKWAGFDKPRWLAKNSTGSEFHYNANRSRVLHLEFDQLSGGTPSHYTKKKIYALGAAVEVDYNNTSPSGTTWAMDTVRVYVPAPNGTAGTREFSPGAPSGQQEKLFVYHQDHLGSIDQILPFGSSSATASSDDNGRAARYSYDAWGQRRNADTWSGAPVNTAHGGGADVTPRGYTGHEMLDGAGLIHMNGRIYDPLLGRFLSADILVDGVGNLQGYNRYSYVQNNPLSKTDPSGHIAIALPVIVEGAVWLTSAEAAHLAAGLYTLAIAAAAKNNVPMLPYGGYSNNAFPWGIEMNNLKQAQAAEMKTKAEAEKRSTAPKPAVEGEKTKETTSGGQMDPSSKEPPKAGQTGKHGELKKEAKGTGLQSHESPSNKAQEKKFIEDYTAKNGRPPTAKEIAENRKQNPAVLLPAEPHQKTDTFGGKNTPAKSTADAADLDAAAQRGAADVKKVGEDSGIDLTKAAEELLELHKNDPRR